MGTVIYRVTGIALSLTVALLGATLSVLLYYGGQDGIDVFYKDSTYMDEHRRIHKRMPTDGWYGELLLKGWALGFVYVVPGLIGITASLFFEKFLMIIHVFVGVLFLIAGSFIHTAGAMAIILFRVFTVNGVIRYDTWPSDCIYVRYSDGLQQDVTDEKCEAGRKALNLAVAATSVCLVAWIFLLCQLLYVGFTYHNIGKTNKKRATGANKESTQSPQTAKSQVPHTDKTQQPHSTGAQYLHEKRPRRRLNTKQRRAPVPPVLSTSEAEIISDQGTTYDNIDNEDLPPTQTTSTFSTFQKSEVMGATSSEQGYDNNAYELADETNPHGTDTEIVKDKPVSTEVVEIEGLEKTAL